MGTRYGNVGSKNIPKKSTEGKARESGGMELRINRERDAQIDGGKEKEDGGMEVSS